MNPSLTLDEANAFLASAGIERQLTQPELEEAAQKHPAGRLKDALSRAATHAGAKQFVLKTIDSLRSAPVTSGQSQAGNGEGAPREASRDFACNIHVYGARAAVEFRPDVNRADFPTVAIDAADALGERRYDWAHKLCVQLTPRELPTVAAVLTGLLPSCEFKHHGPEKNKGFSLTRQERDIAVRVFQGGEGKTMKIVPMPLEEAFYVNCLVLRQLQRAYGGFEGPIVAFALRGYANLGKRTRTGADRPESA